MIDPFAGDPSQGSGNVVYQDATTGDYFQVDPSTGDVTTVDPATIDGDTTVESSTSLDPNSVNPDNVDSWGQVGVDPDRRTRATRRGSTRRDTTRRGSTPGRPTAARTTRVRRTPATTPAPLTPGARTRATRRRSRALRWRARRSRSRLLRRRRARAVGVTPPSRDAEPGPRSGAAVDGDVRLTQQGPSVPVAGTDGPRDETVEHAVGRRRRVDRVLRGRVEGDAGRNVDHLDPDTLRCGGTAAVSSSSTRSPSWISVVTNDVRSSDPLPYPSSASRRRCATTSLRNVPASVVHEVTNPARTPSELTDRDPSEPPTYGAEQVQRGRFATRAARWVERLLCRSFSTAFQCVAARVARAAISSPVGEPGAEPSMPTAPRPFPGPSRPRSSRRGRRAG